MSLLMDALKKAEAAKQQAAEKSSPAHFVSPEPVLELQLQPVTPAAPTTSPLPDLASHSDSVNAELEAVTAPTQAKPFRPVAPPSASHAQNNGNQREAAERVAARNVFSAKQVLPAPSRKNLWLIGGLGCVASLVIGSYFLWQLQSVSSVGTLRPQPPVQAPPVGLVPARPSLATTPAPTLPPAPTAEISTQNPPPAPTSTLTVSATKSGKIQSASAFAPTPRSLQVHETKPAAREKPLQFSASSGRPPLMRAYEALQANRLDEALRGYEQALRSDPRSTDALLGLATIAMRRGQLNDAQAYYQQTLDADPNDATAQAALINLKVLNDPTMAESRLKTALSSQPESAALHFSLGNLYARQQRWSEAQQAYFKACSSEADNADYVFNLAISLDHLHQNKLAAQYYLAALNLANSAHSISFDPKQARQRALELQP